MVDEARAEVNFYGLLIVSDMGARSQRLIFLGAINFPENGLKHFIVEGAFKIQGRNINKDAILINYHKSINCSS